MCDPTGQRHADTRLHGTLDLPKQLAAESDSDTRTLILGTLNHNFLINIVHKAPPPSIFTHPRPAGPCNSTHTPPAPDFLPRHHPRPINTMRRNFITSEMGRFVQRPAGGRPRPRKTDAIK